MRDHHRARTHPRPQQLEPAYTLLFIIHNSYFTTRLLEYTRSTESRCPRCPLLSRNPFFLSAVTAPCAGDQKSAVWRKPEARNRRSCPHCPLLSRNLSGGTFSICRTAEIRNRLYGGNQEPPSGPTSSRAASRPSTWRRTRPAWGVLRVGLPAPGDGGSCLRGVTRPFTAERAEDGNVGEVVAVVYVAQPPPAVWAAPVPLRKTAPSGKANSGARKGHGPSAAVRGACAHRQGKGQDLCCSASLGSLER